MNFCFQFEYNPVEFVMINQLMSNGTGAGFGTNEVKKDWTTVKNTFHALGATAGVLLLTGWGPFAASGTGSSGCWF